MRGKKNETKYRNKRKGSSIVSDQRDDKLRILACSVFLGKFVYRDSSRGFHVARENNNREISITCAQLKVFLERTNF